MPVRNRCHEVSRIEAGVAARGSHLIVLPKRRIDLLWNRLPLMAVMNALKSTPIRGDSSNSAYLTQRFKKVMNSRSLILPIAGCAAEKLLRVSLHWSKKKYPSSVIRFSFKQRLMVSLS